jgi:hypothetical protein
MKEEKDGVKEVEITNDLGDYLAMIKKRLRENK